MEPALECTAAPVRRPTPSPRTPAPREPFAGRVGPAFAASAAARAILGAAALVACTGRIDGPSGARDPKLPASIEAIGPAPLRRLTNAEHLNSLADLFPGVTPDPHPSLPSDGLVAGFDNAAESQRPSDVRTARVEAIANAYAAALTRDFQSVQRTTGCHDWSTVERAKRCADAFIEAFGRKAFRRTLSSSDRTRFSHRLATWMQARDFETAVALTVSTMLQAPQFLYRLEPAPLGTPAGSAVELDAFSLASRLSFLIWESGPDDELLDAAARGELRSAEQLQLQAQRLLDDERARRAYWRFVQQLLGLDRLLDEEHAARSAEVDPFWSSITQAAALRESRSFVETVLHQGGSIADLLVSRRAWPEPEVARLYGVPAAPVADGILLPAGERAGLLTRVAFLAAHSHPGATSPPIRGHAVRTRLLCLPPLVVPLEIDTTPPMPDPDDAPKTNRTLFEERTRPAECRSCHDSLDGLGFGFENHSASGAHQTVDNGLPVDARGAIIGTDVDGPYDGAVELSQRLAASDDVHRCVARLWLRYALGRAPTAEEKWAETLVAGFRARGGVARELLLDIVASPGFRMQKVERETP